MDRLINMPATNFSISNSKYPARHAPGNLAKVLASPEILSFFADTSLPDLKTKDETQI
jgi:hypothetical protein